MTVELPVKHSDVIDENGEPLIGPDCEPLENWECTYCDVSGTYAEMNAGLAEEMVL